MLVQALLLVVALLVSQNSTANYLTGMAEATCRDRTHFGQCFGWSKSECQKQASEALKKCFQRIDLQPPGKLKTAGDLLGSGDRSVEIGTCAEVYLAKAHKYKSEPTCIHYFAKRANDWDSSPVKFDIEAVIKRDKNSRKFLIIQGLVTLLLSLGIPFFFAVLRFRDEPPKRFPWKYSVRLILLSWLGIILAFFVLAKSRVFAQSVGAVGDNPAAIGGFMLGIAASIPLFWIILAGLYRFSKDK